MIKVTKTSPLTGKVNSLDLDVTETQMNLWKSGKHIQDVMPNLSDDEREFLISGLFPGEWEELFGEEE